MTTPLRPAPGTDTVLDERTDERTETGPPKAAHIVKTEPGESAVAKVTEARIYGFPVEALCGERFVPQQDPEEAARSAASARRSTTSTARWATAASPRRPAPDGQSSSSSPLPFLPLPRPSPRPPRRCLGGRGARGGRSDRGRGDLGGHRHARLGGHLEAVVARRQPDQQEERDRRPPPASRTRRAQSPPARLRTAPAVRDGSAAGAAVGSDRHERDGQHLGVVGDRGAAPRWARRRRVPRRRRPRPSASGSTTNGFPSCSPASRTSPVLGSLSDATSAVSPSAERCTATRPLQPFVLGLVDVGLAVRRVTRRSRSVAPCRGAPPTRRPGATEPSIPASSTPTRGAGRTPRTPVPCGAWLIGRRRWPP